MSKSPWYLICTSKSTLPGVTVYVRSLRSEFYREDFFYFIDAVIGSWFSITSHLAAFLKGRAVQGEPHATAINGPVFHLRNKAKQPILLHHGRYDSCTNTLNLGKVVQRAQIILMGKGAAVNINVILYEFCTAIYLYIITRILYVTNNIWVFINMIMIFKFFPCQSTNCPLSDFVRFLLQFCRHRRMQI